MKDLRYAILAQVMGSARARGTWADWGGLGRLKASAIVSPLDSTAVSFEALRLEARGSSHPRGSKLDARGWTVAIRLEARGSTSTGEASHA